jgi:hypothetical protein
MLRARGPGIVLIRSSSRPALELVERAVDHALDGPRIARADCGNARAELGGDASEAGAGGGLERLPAGHGRVARQELGPAFLVPDAPALSRLAGLLGAGVLQTGGVAREGSQMLEVRFA